MLPVQPTTTTNTSNTSTIGKGSTPSSTVPAFTFKSLFRTKQSQSAKNRSNPNTTSNMSLAGPSSLVPLSPNPTLSSTVNWKMFMRGLKDVGESLERFPYVKSIAGVLVQILEIREQILVNEAAAHDLIARVASRSQKLIQVFEQMAKREASEIDGELSSLGYDLSQYEVLLQDVHTTLVKLTQGISGTLGVVQREEVKQTLATLSIRLDDFDRGYMFTRLTDIVIQLGRLVESDARFACRTPVAAAPPPPSSIFCGREAFLADMKTFFSVSQSNPQLSQRRFVLYGLGGSGKTQIALRFIELHSDLFSETFFIDASSHDQLTISFENIGREEKLPDPSVSNVLLWLSRNPTGWLLLFDNADDPNINLHTFFPSSKHGSIIITSRNRACLNHASHPKSFLQVSDLHEEPENAVELLIRAAHIHDPDESINELAATLVNELEYFPLAIVQAGSYLTATITLETYLKLYRKSRHDLLRNLSVQTITSYEKSVYATWELSYGRLSPASMMFLKICSYWHFEGITSEPILRAHAAVNETNRAQVVEPIGDEAMGVMSDFLAYFNDEKREWNDIAFLNIIQELTSYSLINIYADSGAGAYYIHPLVHAWCRDREGSNNRVDIQKAALTILHLSLSSDCDSPGERAYRRSLLPHLDANKPIILQSHHYAAAFEQIYWEAGRWSDVQHMQDCIWMHHQHEFGPDDRRTLQMGEKLARTYMELAKLDVAETQASSVLEAQRKVLGVDDPETWSTMSTLARAYWHLGRYQDAEMLELEVLKKWKASFGVQHPKTLTIMTNLACTYRDNGRASEAEAIELEVIKTRKQVLGEKHPDTLRSMAFLTCTYRDQSRYKEAETLGLEVANSQKQVLGEHHPDTLWSMANLTYTYKCQGRYKDAEMLALRYLDTLTQVLGEYHTDTLWTMENLASAFQHQGRYEEAEILAVEVVNRRKLVLGARHQYTQEAISSLAEIYRSQGKQEAADEVLHELVQTQGRDVV